MPLTNLLCGLLETGINQLQQLDSSAVIKRKQLDGTIIGVRLKELNLPLYFVISAQQVDVLNAFEGEADCFISVSINALKKLQDKQQLTRLIKNGQLEVEGDIQLVQQFADLLTDMQIDWEEHLSQKVGDVLAHKLCYQGKKVATNAFNKGKIIEKQTALYLTEEIKLAPGGLEVAYFCEQVSDLQKQADTLHIKLDAMLNKSLNMQ